MKDKQREYEKRMKKQNYEAKSRNMMSHMKVHAHMSCDWKNPHFASEENKMS